jgi:hypothetical protein
MSATEALAAARTVGIQIRIDGNDLVLEAAVAPPASVIDLLSRYKTAIVRRLRESATEAALAASKTKELQEVFQFAPTGDPANDDEALQERVAIMIESNGWDEVTALREARWQADRERCWRTFLRNAQRVLDAPEPQRESLVVRYRLEATNRYGYAAGAIMAAAMRNWVAARGVH